MTALRVATVPDDHPYVAAVTPADVHRVRTSGRVGSWTPSPWLSPDQLTRRADELDLVHVHFGYESLTADQLNRWTRTAAALRIPVVVTVHDLRNPHEADRADHERRLDVLMATAAAVITLTESAATVIRDRWDRRAEVIAHPSLLSGPVPAGRPARAGTARAGIHFKSLRRNVIDPFALVLAAAEATDAAGATLRVDLHRDVAGRPELAGLWAPEHQRRWEVRVHERFTDGQLVSYLADLDASVLPYRFGTHSGWLEMCRDLGTAVVAPDCGNFADQWAAVHSYTNNETDGLDAASLTTAVRTALTGPRPAPADPARRKQAADDGRRAHARIYRRCLADRFAAGHA